MDIINEDLKVALDFCASDDDRKCDYCYYAERSWCQRDLARDALEQIELLEAIIKDKEKSPWISVEEMLPFLGEKVVVSDGVHTWDYGQYKGFLKGNKHEWWWKNMTPRTVHWWMPKKHALPAPPKEEDHDKLS